MSDYSATFPAQRPVFSQDFAQSGKIDPRATFTRASTANVFDGAKHKSSENLLRYSNDLSNGDWTKARLTVDSTNNAAPDGTTTASSLLETTDNSTHTFFEDYTSVVGVSYTHVWYAKANGRTKLVAYAQGANCVYDLTAVTATTSGMDAVSITAVGSTGWYKCVATETATTASGRLQIELDNGAGQSYAGDVTKGMLFWGFSVASTGETVLNATSGQIHREYAPTLVSKANNAARFETATDGQSEGILIEGSRTNLVTYSNNFGVWSALRVTAEAGASVGPDGQLCYVMREDTTAANTHYVNLSVNGQSTSTTYTMSVYAKKVATSNQTRHLRLRVNGIGGEASVEYNLANGTVNRTYGTFLNSTSISSIGNGWYRLVMTYTNPGGSVASGMIITGSPDTTATLPSYDGDGYSAFALFGAMVEAGSYASSLVTSNSGSQTTRAADSLSMTDSSLFDNGEGTIVAEFALPSGPTADQATTVTGAVVGITASTSNNYVRLQTDTRTNVYSASMYADGSSQLTISSAGDTGGQFVKKALSFKQNDTTLCRNGTLSTTDTNCVTPSGLQTIQFGAVSPSYTGATASGHYKRVAIYSEALSDTNLQALTS
jgi:hypothetical protein